MSCAPLENGWKAVFSWDYWPGHLNMASSDSQDRQLLTCLVIAAREVSWEVRQSGGASCPSLRRPEPCFLCSVLVSRVSKAKSQSERNLMPSLSGRSSQEFIGILNLPQRQLMEQDSEQPGEFKWKAKIDGLSLEWWRDMSAMEIRTKKSVPGSGGKNLKMKTRESEKSCFHRVQVIWS